MTLSYAVSNQGDPLPGSTTTNVRLWWSIYQLSGLPKSASKLSLQHVGSHFPKEGQTLSWEVGIFWAKGSISRLVIQALKAIGKDKVQPAAEEDRKIPSFLKQEKRGHILRDLPLPPYANEW